MIIEEINRGNCAQIFGDLFQLLDRNDNGFSEYPINADADLEKHLAKEFKDMEIPEFVENEFPEYLGDIVADIKQGKVLVLPNNLYIWATMNTSDQSLFPIDSAFKRRWDWNYVKIKDEHKHWKIQVDTAQYDWWQFLEAINKVILGTTNSEDKQLGYYFAKAKDGVITAETFVSKVLFYLWNDVFKDYGFDGELFKMNESENLSFPSFYIDQDVVNTENVKRFLQNLGIQCSDEREEDEFISDPNERTKTEELRYAYWTEFLKYANDNANYAQYFGGVKSPTKRSWLNFSIAEKDCYLSVSQIRKTPKLVVALYFNNKTNNYYKLSKQKDVIEKDLDIQLNCDDKPDKKACSIEYVDLNVNFEDKEKHIEQFNQIINMLLKMRETFKKYLA